MDTIGANTDRKTDIRIAEAYMLFNLAGNVFSLGRSADDVLGEDIVAASHGEPDAVPVAVERVVRHIGAERLEHRHPSVAVAVDVVAWNQKEAILGAIDHQGLDEIKTALAVQAWGHLYIYGPPSTPNARHLTATATVTCDK